MSLSEKEILPSFETALESGTILRKEPDSYAVWLRDEEVSAHRAAGCLLDPEPGDRVLLVGLAGEPLRILSVLARASGETARLTFPSGLDLAVSGKPLAIRSPEGVVLETDASLRVACGDCGIRAGSVSLTARTMSWAGEACSFVAGTFRVAARLLETLSGHLETKAKSAFRQIETVDHTRTGQTTLETDSLYSLRTGDALIEARNLAKIDAEQVHLG